MTPLDSQQSDSPWREWWVFYIDPTKPQGSPWQTAGSIAGPYTADEAIRKTAGRRFAQPFWAFALDKGDAAAFYDLHYPEGVEPHLARDSRLGPAGYVAEPDALTGEQR